VEIEARVGIHTGPAVVGEMGGKEKPETMALGDTLNVAARLEAFAEPGSVVISDATLRLVPGIFVTEDRGVPELKGISEPLRVHKIVQPSGIRSRLDRATGLTPFVGREEELGLLLSRLEQAQEGQGQAVLVAGEAGIGKSRLVHRLREKLRDTPHSWLECHTSPYTQSSALYPLIEMLEGALDFREEDSAEEKLGRLERGLAHVGLEPDEAVPLFASLLSLRLPERYARMEISPQLQRQKTLETLLAWVLALGEKQPLVLVVEDLHWIDPSTLEWLGLLIEECPTENVLLMMTHRPDFEPPWPARGHVLALGLNRLSRHQSQDLVARATAEAALPAELVERIASRSDGVPLFVEELAKGALEAGHTDSLDIPETLQDSLMARLDRLGDAKQVAQLGAAIGREVEYTLLEAVAPVSEAALREGLGRLVEAELVYRRGLPPRATYTFKHALVQDTAYQSLLESQRKELHGRIADALEARFPERVATEPEVVGRHCDEAGRTAQAIAYYQRAGERATQRWAPAEAVDHLHGALERLGTLPESAERDHQELELQFALGSPLISSKGYGDAEIGRVFHRARDLCAHLDETRQLFRALIGLSLHYYQLPGQLPASTDFAKQALVIAERTGEVYHGLVAYTRLGICLYMSGELSQAREHLERAVDLYDPDEHRALASVWGQDWGIFARAYLAWAVGQLGYCDRARRMHRETIELARGGDPYSLAYAYLAASISHWFHGGTVEARQPADEAIAISRQRGFGFLLWMATLVRKLCSASPELDTISQLLAQGEGRTTMAGIQLALVRMHREAGRIEAARATLERIASRSYPLLDDSPLQRERGEILVEEGATEEAEHCFRRALEIARDQNIRFYELAAATSLARLLRDQGHRGEARALLSPVYAWFTEGFDTADLKDAKALLDEL
jgi:tetratricopeptide (TPR) repeat protein